MRIWLRHENLSLPVAELTAASEVAPLCPGSEMFPNLAMDAAIIGRFDGSLDPVFGGRS
jgi:hypothetical protein